MHNIYIHIGFPKNASTMLETFFFPYIENVHYMGKVYNGGLTFPNAELESVFENIEKQESLYFDLEKSKDIVNKYLEKIESHEKILISSEGFTTGHVDRGVIAQRLKQIFPQAKILIIVREQLSSLISMYAYLVGQNGLSVNLAYGRPSVKSFKEWVLEQEDYLECSYLQKLKYSKLIDAYSALFPKVNVLLYEELCAHPENFCRGVCEFLDLGEDYYRYTELLKNKENARPSGLRLAFGRLLKNKVIKKIKFDWVLVKIRSITPQSIKQNNTILLKNNYQFKVSPNRWTENR